MAEINTEETVVLDNTEEFKILDENNWYQYYQIIITLIPDILSTLLTLMIRLFFS